MQWTVATVDSSLCKKPAHKVHCFTWYSINIWRRVLHPAEENANWPSPQILKVIEKSVPDVEFNFQDHLLGGVSESSFILLPLFPWQWKRKKRALLQGISRQSRFSDCSPCSRTVLCRIFVAIPLDFKEWSAPLSCSRNWISAFDISLHVHITDKGMQASIDVHQNPLTDEALEAAKNAHAILLGAIGGPKYGTGPVRPEQGMSRNDLSFYTTSYIKSETPPQPQTSSLAHLHDYPDCKISILLGITILTHSQAS